MSRDVWLFVVMTVAVVIALVSALSFFSGQFGVGLVTLGAAWLLVGWGGKYARPNG